MRSLFFYLLGLCLFLTGTGPFGVRPSLSKEVSLPTPYVKGVYRALIIGNSEYKDPQGLWVPLKTPIVDADAVAKMLRDDYGFHPRDMTLLKNATRAGILSAFSRMAEISEENDSVFIYYAGHGYANPDTKEAFWIPVDAVGKEDYTYVRNSTIKSKLAVIADRAKHVFLVSDSCFSASLILEGHRGIRPTEKTEQYYNKVARKKSVQILAAGGLEFVDDNYKETGHSPFTYFFLKHLEQNTEGYYSATEISLDVAKAVSANVYQTPEKGILHGAGDNNGEFFFLGALKTSKPETASKAPSHESLQTPTLDEEAEMWVLVKDSDNVEDIKAFLAAFPEGRLTPVARLKLNQLERRSQRGAGTREPAAVKAGSVEEEKRRSDQESALAEELGRMQEARRKYEEMIAQMKDLSEAQRKSLEEGLREEAAKRKAIEEELKRLKTERERPRPEQTGEKRLASIPREVKAPTDRPSEPGTDLKLAVFPIKVTRNVDRNIPRFAKALEWFAAESGLFAEVYSYYALAEKGKIKKIDRGLGKKEVWHRKGLFSRLEPNVDLIIEEGRGLGVDVVLLGFFDIEGEVSSQAFYLIDVHQRKVHTSKGNLGKGQKTKFKSLVDEVLTAYKKNR
jgi:hypothetical protein